MRAIFLDRDGVICENRADHVKAWDEFRFLPGVLSGLADVARAGFVTVVVTNQAIINRSVVPAEAVHDIHRRMLDSVRRAGGRIDRVMVCPHRPDERCTCRKPQPGLLLQAAAEMHIDLSRSYMIGDATSDIQAGLAAGCACFMVMTGRGTKQAAQTYAQALPGVRYARDLKHAVQMTFFLETFGDNHPALIQAARPPLTRPLTLPVLHSHAL